MDPISIGSSICALVGIGSAIYFGLEDIKGAPHAIENVRLEIAGLRTVLTRLKHLLEQDVNSLNLFPDDVREDLARNLQSLMDIKLQLSETLQSYMNMSAGKWLSSVIRQLKWVLVREKDVEKLRKHLEAHKNTLGLTLMMMSNLCLAQIQDQLNRRSSSASQMSGSAAYCGACPGAKLEDIGKYVKKLQDQVNSKKGHGRGHIHRMRDLPSNEEVIDCSGVQRYVDSLAEFVRSGKYEQTVRTVQSAPRPPHDESAPAELMEALKSEPTPTSACASNEKSDNCPGCDQTPPANRPSRNALIWPPILNEPVPWDEKKLFDTIDNAPWDALLDSFDFTSETPVSRPSTPAELDAESSQYTWTNPSGEQRSHGGAANHGQWSPPLTPQSTTTSNVTWPSRSAQARSHWRVEAEYTPAITTSAVTSPLLQSQGREQRPSNFIYTDNCPYPTPSLNTTMPDWPVKDDMYPISPVSINEPRNQNYNPPNLQMDQYQYGCNPPYRQQPLTQSQYQGVGQNQYAQHTHAYGSPQSFYSQKDNSAWQQKKSTANSFFAVNLPAQRENRAFAFKLTGL